MSDHGLVDASRHRRSRRRSASRRSSSRSPPSASTSTSATPACSTSARSASCCSAAYGIAISVADVGPAVLARHPRRPRRAPSSSPCCSASRPCGCAPTTSPSSPSRRPRSSGCCSDRCRRPRVDRRHATACRRSTATSSPSTPTPAAAYDILGTSAGTSGELWIAHRRLDRSSRLSCLLVWLLMRSPWGRVLKAIREDEDAVRSLGKNVYAYKMQALILGGVIGAPRRHHLRARHRRRSSPTVLQQRHHVLRLHRPDPRRRGPGAAARSSAR